MIWFNLPEILELLIELRVTHFFNTLSWGKLGAEIQGGWGEHVGSRGGSLIGTLPE